MSTHSFGHPVPSLALHFTDQPSIAKTEAEIIKKVKSLPRTQNLPSDSLKKSSSCAALTEAFNQSLITRLRGVSRGSPDGVLGGAKEVQARVSKLTKSRPNVEAMREHAIRWRTGEAGEGGEEVTALRVAVERERRRNQELTTQIEQYECEIFIYRQQIEQLNEELREKDRAMQELDIISKQRQQEYALEFHALADAHEQLVFRHDQLLLKQEAEAQERQARLSLESVLEERVIGVPAADKVALLRAREQLAATRRQHEAAVSEMRRQREGQVEQLRRKFVRNLNHYKDIIIKFTSKSEGRFKDSFLESTLTENSSNDETH